MARPLQILYRIWSSSVASSFSVHGVRFSSRGASRAGMGRSHDHRHGPSGRASRYSDQMPEDHFGLEEVEEKLQTVVDEERKRQKTVKYHILRRQMTPSGPPQRKLTWDAMEQIRYLKREQPEEWTVERLAEGFSVTPDVILRVLKSKFVPSPERKAKQDTKAVTGLAQQVLPSGAGRGSDQLKLAGNCAQAVLPSGQKDAVVPVADRTLTLQYGSTEANSLISYSVLPNKVRAGINRDASVTTSETNPIQEEEGEEEEEEEEEGWDGTVFTEEELEQYTHMKKPSPAVQVGNDFFDAEGNFLYRI